MSTTEEHFYRFPPFPDPPDGATVVPFESFTPTGYKHITDLASGELIEVDAWAGIRTVKLLSEGEAAKRKKAKKRRRNAGNATDESGRLIPWWEEWEASEASREMGWQMSFDGQMSLEDRVCLAADDFRVGRNWPEIAQGVRLLWDQFRLYIGLISSIPQYKKVTIKKKGQVDAPNDGGEASEEEEDVPRAKQTKVTIVQDHLEQTAIPGKQLEPSPEQSTVEAQRLRDFLQDMEKTVKVFLSSYMRDTGLIWTERNLFIAPTVLHFFLRFMLRNGIFADSEAHLDNLKRAVSVAALAQKELPLTGKHGKVLPTRFHLACKECLGIQGSMSIQISSTIPPHSEVDTPTNDASPTSSVFEAELKEQDIQIVPSKVVLDSITARQVMEDNVDTDLYGNVPVTTIPVTGDPWAAAIEAEEYTTDSWTDKSVPWLMQHLGPTVFPLTMTTGIVEFSTRRVRDIIPPQMSTGTRKASVVEEVLEEGLFKVVMSPWVGSVSEETMDFPSPEIMPGSRGAVVTEGMGHCGAWNPYQDDVTILVGEEVAGDFMVGMGLCGTWVQMVPLEGEGKRHARECYWYVESLVASFPSYYTEGEMIEEEVFGEDDDE